MSIAAYLKRVVQPLAQPGIGRATWHVETAPYTTVVNNGDPKQRLDVAIMADGYAREEMSLFSADADKVIEAFHEIEPMKSYIGHFNFHRVDVVSEQSGVSDMWSNPPIRRKSALGSHFSFLSERRLVGWDWRVRQVAKRAGVPYDAILVIVNTPRRGGATRFSIGIGYASRNSSDFPRIMIHESGHCIAKLNDEYIDPLVPNFPSLKGKSLPNFLPFANVTTNAKHPQWWRWIDPKTPLPTPLPPDRSSNIVGAFEGASYTAYGVYRPMANCMMRSHGYPFCPVCQEQYIKRIYCHTQIADRFSPAEEVELAKGAKVTFSAETVRRDNIQTTWQLRDPFGRWRPAQTTPSYQSFTTVFGEGGNWVVECHLEDRSPMLRNPSVIQTTKQKQRWLIAVQ